MTPESTAFVIARSEATFSLILAVAIDSVGVSAPIANPRDPSSMERRLNRRRFATPAEQAAILVEQAVRNNRNVSTSLQNQVIQS
uniref:Homeobox domain-containing protein n=1 Tax=Panagrellus redivivus TaxID=6233 RepID=A0A7E4V6Y4_PANRE